MDSIKKFNKKLIIIKINKQLIWKYQIFQIKINN